MNAFLWNYIFTLISPYLISGRGQNISNFLPSKRRNRDPEKICCQIWTNVKLTVEFLSKFQGDGIKIEQVNAIRIVKPLIFFNILRAVAR